MNGYRRDIAEPAPVKQAWSENITFGVNRGAAITIIIENCATDYRWCKGPSQEVGKLSMTRSESFESEVGACAGVEKGRMLQPFAARMGRRPPRCDK